MVRVTNEHNHYRQWTILLSVMILINIWCSLSFAQTATSAATTPPPDLAAMRILDEKNGGKLGINLLAFVGPLSDIERDHFPVPADSLLLGIPRRSVNSKSGLAAVPYYFLIRNVSQVERDMLQDSADKEWNQFDIVTASLIAEGVVEAATLNSYHTTIQGHVEKIRELEKQRSGRITMRVSSTSQEDRTRLVFQYLHQNILRGKYDSKCTNLEEVFQTGNYNCVSATLLFNAMALNMELAAFGLEKPGHALSRVRYDRGQYEDLETTVPNWYSLPRGNGSGIVAPSRPAPATIGQPIAGRPSFPTTENTGANNTGTRNNSNGNGNESTSQLREVSPVELIATVYYNKGVDHMLDDEFAATIVCSVKALQLDVNNESVWNHLLAPINNWAIKYAEQQRYNVAAQLLEDGRMIDSEYSRFRFNQRHVYCSWIKALAERNRLADAELVFQRAQQWIPDDNYVLAAIEDARNLGK